MLLALVGLGVFLLNLPFGFWRNSVRPRSLQWVLAIHLPVPAVVALRILSGVGFSPVSYAVLIGAYFLGQFTGGRVRQWLISNRAPATAPVEELIDSPL